VANLPEADIITPDMLDALALSPQTTRLLLKTRNSALWADPHHHFHQDFVALSTQAAQWIIRKGIDLVGIDYLSIQLFKDAESLTHRTLLDGGVIIVEGLNLKDVAPGIYHLICLPIKLSGSDGAPTRAVLVQE
jgi:arylformamidase